MKITSSLILSLSLLLLCLLSGSFPVVSCYYVGGDFVDSNYNAFIGLLDVTFDPPKVVSKWNFPTYGPSGDNYEGALYDPNENIFYVLYLNSSYSYTYFTLNLTNNQTSANQTLVFPPEVGNLADWEYDPLYGVVFLSYTSPNYNRTTLKSYALNSTTSTVTQLNSYQSELNLEDNQLAYDKISHAWILTVLTETNLIPVRFPLVQGNSDVYPSFTTYPNSSFSTPIFDPSTNALLLVNITYPQGILNQHYLNLAYFDPFQNPYVLKQFGDPQIASSVWAPWSGIQNTLTPDNSQYIVSMGNDDPFATSLVWLGKDGSLKISGYLTTEEGNHFTSISTLATIPN
eukprot:TRINITY_DN674_c0_g2_i1.p1 TRINITY_DN674_c0_g2~~TRINITY_DN674_c0_g2_i1.p1  ORF type:complete len:344 (+),score=54.83 TRINITY_DN674_c0_g2_i1:448-1479(+)